MATGVSVLENLPSIEDVRNICHTIQEMGGKCRFLDKHTLEIDCNEGVSYQATFEGRAENARILLSHWCASGTL